MAPIRFHTAIFNFFIFSNLFIACCATAMAWFTADFFSAPFSATFAGLVFFGTLTSYSIHWFLTNETIEITSQRTPWLSAHKKIHLWLFGFGTLGTFIFLMPEKENIKWIIPAALLTMLYSAPKIPHPFFQKLTRYILGKTLVLATVWTYVTTILPLLVQHLQWQLVHFTFLANRFLLIFAICILFDLRDRDYDRSSGVKSVITLLQHRPVKIIFFATVIAGLTTSALLGITEKDIIAAIITAFPVAITAFFYCAAKRTTNDYLFYFLLDGLMALSPLLWMAKNIIFGQPNL